MGTTTEHGLQSNTEAPEKVMDVDLGGCALLPEGDEATPFPLHWDALSMGTSFPPLKLSRHPFSFCPCPPYPPLATGVGDLIPFVWITPLTFCQPLFLFPNSPFPNLPNGW